jgi:hypothetical protein
MPIIFSISYILQILPTKAAATIFQKYILLRAHLRITIIRVMPMWTNDSSHKDEQPSSPMGGCNRDWMYVLLKPSKNL